MMKVTEIVKMLKRLFKKKRPIVPHHDSRTNSYYQTAQRTLRDARRYD